MREYKWLYQIKGWRNMTAREWIYEIYYIFRKKIKHIKED